MERHFPRAHSELPIWEMSLTGMAQNYPEEFLRQLAGQTCGIYLPDLDYNHSVPSDSSDEFLTTRSRTI